MDRNGHASARRSLFVESRFHRRHLCKAQQGVAERGAVAHVDSLIVQDDVAIVELHSEATARNGLRFDNHYCWVCYFKNDTIVRVRAYLDSVMVARLFAENPI